MTSETETAKAAKAKALALEAEKMNQLNDKLEQVKRKRRIKQLVAEDLVRKGASASLAKSYVISLEEDDLKRIKESQKLAENDERFVRKPLHYGHAHTTKQ